MFDVFIYGTRGVGRVCGAHRTCGCARPESRFRLRYEQTQNICIINTQTNMIQHTMQQVHQTIRQIQTKHIIIQTNNTTNFASGMSVSCRRAPSSGASSTPASSQQLLQQYNTTCNTVHPYVLYIYIYIYTYRLY